jgi:flagellar biosynthesis anti-sigma factor FlgM
MKISDLFGRTVVYGNQKSSQGRSVEEEKASEQRRAQVLGDGDRMTISDKGKLLFEVARIQESEEVRQAARVARIKQMVESGEYNVSSKAVAEKLSEFLTTKSF